MVKKKRPIRPLEAAEGGGYDYWNQYPGLFSPENALSPAASISSNETLDPGKLIFPEQITTDPSVPEEILFFNDGRSMSPPLSTRSFLKPYPLPQQDPFPIEEEEEQNSEQILFYNDSQLVEPPPPTAFGERGHAAHYSESKVMQEGGVGEKREEGERKSEEALPRQPSPDVLNRHAFVPSPLAMNFGETFQEFPSPIQSPKSPLSGRISPGFLNVGLSAEEVEAFKVRQQTERHFNFGTSLHVLEN